MRKEDIKVVTERQVLAILGVLGTFVAFGFAIYNVYATFKPTSQLKKT